MTIVAPNTAVRPVRSVSATLCRVSAAAAMVGLLALSTLGHAPASHSLTWFAVAAYGCAAPLAFVGYVLSLSAASSQPAQGSDDDVDPWLRHVPLAIDVAAASGVAGLFAGAACMTTSLLFGTDTTHVGRWPLYAYAVVFVLLVLVLVRTQHASGVDVRAFRPTDGFRPSMQLVADNTRPQRSLGRTKLNKRRVRIDPFAESELHDFARKYGCTPEQLRAACVAVGTVADDVEAYLANRHEGGQG